MPGNLIPVTPSPRTPTGSTGSPRSTEARSPRDAFWLRPYLPGVLELQIGSGRGSAFGGDQGTRERLVSQLLGRAPAWENGKCPSALLFARCPLVSGGAPGIRVFHHHRTGGGPGEAEPVHARSRPSGRGSPPCRCGLRIRGAAGPKRDAHRI